MLRALFLLVIIILFGQEVHSQSDSLEQEPVHSDFLFKSQPMVGLGLGTFNFFGEIGSGYRTNSPLSSNAAYSFTAQIPLNYNLDFSFTGVKTNLVINEPGVNLLNNFQSDITGGTVMLSYNFEDFLPKKAYIQPYIGTGISSFEFLSKADLYDSNGNKYHIWDNGALMSIAQDSPDAHEAMPLKRDFIYETDLRGLNTEGLGSYSDNVISIPLSAGMNFKLSKHLKGQLGTTVHFTTKDLIDNVSIAPESRNKRDLLVHSSLSLSYDLHFPSKEGKEFEIEFDDSDEDALADYFDSDKDGINDLDDDCLDHPEGITVDERGCPLDSDNDGVPDFKDDEPMTLAENMVDQYGVTVEEDIYLEKYMHWIDSLTTNTMFSQVYGEPDLYSVLVIPPKGGFSQDEINSLLSEEDIRQNEKEGEEGLLIGEYESLPDAMGKQKELETQGLSTELHKENSGESIDISPDEMASAEEELLTGNLDGSSSGLGNTDPNFNNDLYTEDVVYRVQIGAFRYALSENIFADVDDLIILKGDDDLTRYMSDSYKDPMSAAERRVDLLTEGFEGAFITAYSKGQRITLSEAGLQLTPGASDLTTDVENNSIAPGSVKFRIQLGEHSGEIPTELLDKYLEIGKVNPVEEQKVTRYMTGDFESYEDAEEFLAQVRAGGIDGSQILGTFEGRLISLEEALNILGKDK